MIILAQESDDKAEHFEAVKRLAFLDAPLQQSLDRLVRLAARELNTPIAVLSLVDGEQLHFIAKHGIDAVQIDRRNALCTHAIRQNDVFVIPDTLTDPRSRENPLVKQEPKVRFYAGAPLKTVSDGPNAGTLCVLDVKPRPPLSEREQTLLTDLAAIAADQFEMCTAKIDVLSEARARMAAERCLAATANQLKLSIEHAPAPIAILNRDLEYIATSRRWREDYGLGDQELVGRSHYEVFPNIPDRWRAIHKRCLRGETMKCDEDVFYHADGSTAWLRWEIQPWIDDSGTVGGLIIFNENITERKRAADELERNQHFLNTVLESVQEGIVACDAQGRLNVFNSAAKRLLEADLKDIPPEQWAEHYRVYEADGRTLLKTKKIPLFRALRGEIVEDEELVLIPKGHSPRRIICNAQAMRVRSGAQIGAVVSMQDVTEKMEIEAQYRQAQKMEAIGQLTGGLAHDFNNLLAVVLGNLELLQRAIGNEKKLAHQAAAATAAAQRGAELTNRLLAFSRRQTLEEKTIGVNALIKELEELLSRTLGETVRLETVLEDGLWAIHADKSQLEAAILNLAINARDAMEEDEHLTIQTKNVSLDKAQASYHAELRPGDYVMISISDRGQGMSEEIRKRAFEPFFTTKEAGKGSGLGLSMVYGFIKQSQGHIDIQSRPAGGTTINMYFPRSFQAADLERELPSREETLLHDRESHARAERILIVEDNPAVRDIAVAMVEDLGYETSEAATGQAALELLESSDNRFGLVLTDVVMPGELNGPSLAKIINKRFPETKVLFTSGYAEASVLHDSRVQNSGELIRKPFCQETLARKIREALNRSTD